MGKHLFSKHKVLGSIQRKEGRYSGWGEKGSGERGQEGGEIGKRIRKVSRMEKIGANKHDQKKIPEQRKVFSISVMSKKIFNAENMFQFLDPGDGILIYTTLSTQPLSILSSLLKGGS